MDLYGPPSGIFLSICSLKDVGHSFKQMFNEWVTVIWAFIESGVALF